MNYGLYYWCTLSGLLLSFKYVQQQKNSVRFSSVVYRSLLNDKVGKKEKNTDYVGK